jgi:hypothetical protein
MREVKIKKGRKRGKKKEKSGKRECGFNVGESERASGRERKGKCEISRREE